MNIDDSYLIHIWFIDIHWYPGIDLHSTCPTCNRDAASEALSSASEKKDFMALARHSGAAVMCEVRKSTMSDRVTPCHENYGSHGSHGSPFYGLCCGLLRHQTENSMNKASGILIPLEGRTWWSVGLSSIGAANVEFYCYVLWLPEKSCILKFRAGKINSAQMCSYHLISSPVHVPQASCYQLLPQSNQHQQSKALHRCVNTSLKSQKTKPSTDKPMTSLMRINFLADE